MTARTMSIRCRVFGHKWIPGVSTPSIYVSDKCARCSIRRAHGDGGSLMVETFVAHAIADIAKRAANQ